MAYTIRRPAGAAAAVVDALTLPDRALVIDTTNHRVRIGDGTTPGGVALAKLSEATAFTASGAGAVATTVASRLNRMVFVSDYMNLATRVAGTTDDAPAFQAAATAADALGGVTVLIDPSLSPFKFGSAASGATGVGVVCRKGTRFVSWSLSEVTSSTNGSGGSTPRIAASAATSTALFMWAPTTAGDHIYGAGFEGLELQGGYLCNYGAILDNCVEARVLRNRAQTFNVAGIWISSYSGTTSNFGMYNTVDGLHYVYGAGSSGANANAVLITGNSAGSVLSTQHKIRNVRALLNNGFAVELRQVDNCLLENIQMNGVGGTGGALWLRNVASPANSNWCRKITGPIKEDAGLYGNVFEDCISEGAGKSGSTRYHGSWVDYGTGERTITPSKVWVGKMPVSGAGLVDISSTSIVMAGGVFPARKFPKSAAGIAGVTIPSPYAWGSGKITAIEVEFSISSAASAKTVAIRPRLSTLSETAGYVLESNQVFAMSVPATADTRSTQLLTLSTPLTFSAGDTIAISFVRDPTDAADTSTGDLTLLGINLRFVSNGPTTAGSGTYDPPIF